MVESPPLKKSDEQHPLLMANGGGDNGPRGPPKILSSVWNVQSLTPKRPWLDRWPEFLSTCWMTFILLGISFLVFYAIGMVAFRRQPYIVIKCNNSNPASDVYYYHVIQRGAYTPFSTFSDYLATMSTQYPSLRFNVFFLLDDTGLRGISSRSRLYSKLISYHYTTKIYEELNRRDVWEFQRRYHNVNITVIPMAKFMAMTPLKYKWRSIPVTNLLFYARMFTLWQSGGIGMDLTTFNDMHLMRRHPDRKISTILKEHNDGFKIDEYAEMLKILNSDEENELLVFIYGLVNKLLNETCSLFNKPFTTSTVAEKNKTEPLIRTHRRKRYVPNEIKASNSSLTDSYNETYIVLANATVFNTTDDFNFYRTANETNYSDNFKPIKREPLLSLRDGNTNDIVSDFKSSNSSEIYVDVAVNKSEPTQILLFYDFSLFSDRIGPSYLSPESSQSQIGSSVPEIRSKATHHSQILAIEAEGLFVAVTSPLHPFLEHIISAGCRLMPPKLAIQDAMLSQCSGPSRDDDYCNSIYIF